VAETKSCHLVQQKWKSRDQASRSLQSSNHAADLGSSTSTSLLLEESNKGAKRVLLLSGLSGHGSLGSHGLGGLNCNRLDLAGLGSDGGGCNSRGSSASRHWLRRSSGTLAGTRLGSLGLDALRVVRVPGLAFQTLGAQGRACEAVAAALEVLLEESGTGTLSWLGADRGGERAGDHGRRWVGAVAGGDDRGCQRGKGGG
jgi:hypothetical protein